METKAHHVLIGAFTLAVILAAFVFIIILGRFSGTNDAFYDVKFLDAVSGLSVGGEVRYNGVKVGEVSHMRFDRSDPSAVFVTVRIKSRPDFALREDAVVSLELLGITGLTYVHIEGGLPDSDLLPQVHNPDGNLPVIEAQPSAIQQLYERVPDIMEQIERTTSRLADIMSSENQAKFESILTSLDEVSGTVASRSDDISDIVSNMQNLSERFDSIANNVDTVMTEDVGGLVEELRTLTSSVDGVVGLTETMLAENRDSLSEFSNQGLPQLTLLVGEARHLVVTIDRIAQRLEKDPTGFILRNQGTEYEAGR